MSKTFFEETIEVTKAAEEKLRAAHETQTAALFEEIKSKISAAAKEGKRQINLSYPASTYGVDLCAEMLREQGFTVTVSSNKGLVDSLAGSAYWMDISWYSL